MKEVISINGFEDVMNKVEEVLLQANKRLANIVKDGFPFTMEEVKMTVETDSAGIYVHSGKTPICAVARFGSPLAVVREIEDAVKAMVTATENAVDRREGLDSEAADLATEDEKRAKAIAALEAAGLSSDIIGSEIDPAGVREVVRAARAACHEASRGLYLNFEEACEALGGRDESKLKLKTFSNGFIVTAGGKPCLVTRFPKVCSAKVLERMKEFILADVAALGESRREYLQKVQLEVEREKRLHEVAKALDAANDQLKELKVAVM